jgi:hypothetical protein
MTVQCPDHPPAKADFIDLAGRSYNAAGPAKHRTVDTSNALSDARYEPEDRHCNRSAGSRVVSGAALVVTAAAGVVTAHGLLEVAKAAGVSTPAAWLYPVITDGLALLAYSAGTRLSTRGRRYAATLVILAAGLSGAAQAVYLAGGLHRASNTTAALRFGVGAWPAVAAALSAHLLHLIRTAASSDVPGAAGPSHSASETEASNPARGHPASGSASDSSTGLDAAPAVQSARRPTRASTTGPDGRTAHDRAREAARRYRDQHGTLPTATRLAELAATSRSTAGAALKSIRDDNATLHIVHSDGPTGPRPDGPPPEAGRKR